jgi:hypothetical protein
MKGLEDQTYLFALIAFNVLALFFVFSAFQWPRIARVLFFLLFAWASWTNWRISQHNPAAYLEYAELTFSGFYRNFINGWFSGHIQLAVGFIATCQALIAVSMFLKGWIFKTGCVGAILFLLSIAPLGVGSGFPCTIIFAFALVVLFKKGKEYCWIRKPGSAQVKSSGHV